MSIVCKIVNNIDEKYSIRGIGQLSDIYENRNIVFDIIYDNLTEYQQLIYTNFISLQTSYYLFEIVNSPYSIDCMNCVRGDISVTSYKIDYNDLSNEAKNKIDAFETLLVYSTLQWELLNQIL